MVMLNANARNCFCLYLIVLLGMVSGNALAKGQTTRVSVTSSGMQAQHALYDLGTGGSISADGRYIAFPSYATNLVAGDTNGAADVFVHDRLTKQTTRVSVARVARKAVLILMSFPASVPMAATWPLCPVLVSMPIISMTFFMVFTSMTV